MTASGSPRNLRVDEAMLHTPLGGGACHGLVGDLIVELQATAEDPLADVGKQIKASARDKHDQNPGPDTETGNRVVVDPSVGVSAGQTCKLCLGHEDRTAEEPNN